MKAYIIMIQKTWDGKSVPFKQLKDMDTAKNMALDLFKEERLHRVAVIEAKVCEGSHRFHVVYEQMRFCKHKNIQGEWNFAVGDVEFKCCECGAIMRKHKDFEKALAEA